MSLFIHIFCRDAAPFDARQVADFIEEGGYFPTPPRTSHSPADGDWTELKIEYQAKKRPVLLHRQADPDELEEEVQEAVEACQGKADDARIARLKGTRQIISLELDSRGATEDCWEMVDNLEGWIARERQGLVYVSGEGLYDEKLQLLCELSD